MKFNLFKSVFLTLILFSSSSWAVGPCESHKSATEIKIQHTKNIIEVANNLLLDIANFLPDKEVNYKPQEACGVLDILKKCSYIYIFETEKSEVEAIINETYVSNAEPAEEYESQIQLQNIEAKYCL